jgi:hypothetical protein
MKEVAKVVTTVVAKADTVTNTADSEIEIELIAIPPNREFVSEST